MAVTEQQHQRALDVVCGFEDNRGYSRGDLLLAICLALGLDLPEMFDVSLKDGKSLLHELAD